MRDMAFINKKFFTRNNVIVMLNITAACMLLFCLCFFFFSNPKMFLKDIKSYMAFSPVLLVVGTGFVCYYIMHLVFHLDAGTSHRADSLTLVYKIVFTVTFILLVGRSFLGDFMPETVIIDGVMRSEITNPNLNVPIPMIIMALISGLITWLTPSVRDNDNTEF